ncbi:MAG: hypothetical protein J6L87_06880, partial [Clostridia bacterium]|nr:hypothetical protein [Clostridia bacterium]
CEAISLAKANKTAQLPYGKLRKRALFIFPADADIRIGFFREGVEKAKEMCYNDVDGAARCLSSMGGQDDDVITGQY